MCHGILGEVMYINPIIGRDHNAGINIKQLALFSLGMSDVVVQAESMRASMGKLCI